MARPRTTSEAKKLLARERKRRQRARERASGKGFSLLSDAARPHISGSFATYIAERSLTLFETLDAAGVRIVGSLAEEDHVGVYPARAEWEERFGAPLNSLNRATVMIEALLDSAQELAGLVNQFKLFEIDQRIAEATRRGGAQGEIEALHQIKKRYRRSVSPRFPMYWVRANHSQAPSHQNDGDHGF